MVSIPNIQYLQERLVSRRSQTLGLELSYHLHKGILYYSVLKVVLPIHSNVLKGFAPGYLLIQVGSFRSGGEKRMDDDRGN